MRELVLAAAGPGPGNWKGLCSRAAKHAGVTFRAAKQVYYGEIDPDHGAVQSIKMAAGKHVAPTAGQWADYAENMAHILDAIDPDFHGPHANAWRAVARTLRGLRLPEVG